MKQNGGQWHAQSNKSGRDYSPHKNGCLFGVVSTDQNFKNRHETTFTYTFERTANTSTEICREK